ncbi:MAG: cisplatin damage response ATP-dependent DNA ligase, partial [Planctomycetota bacterium]
WTPDTVTWDSLIHAEDPAADAARPYPFYLAYALEDGPDSLGDSADWRAEWKWDGIRGQVVRRAGEVLLWSRGEDHVNSGFPELVDSFREIPDGTVLDGELLAWKDDRPLGFHALQRRIQRKSVGKKLREEVPVRFVAYDLLEENGGDLRALPTEERRARLEAFVAAHPLDGLGLADVVEGETWDDLAVLRATSRERGVEGLMLKRRDATYGAGRTRGEWWKWKIDPLTVDTVLVHAQRGHGRRASLYTDYTLAVWADDGTLVPVAKAYSGLTDAEIRRVDRFVRQNIVERFGPVRSVTPQLVFEIAFEGIAPSTRHKAGLALRFPRIARWREDKAPAEADRLADLQRLLED